MYFDNDGMVVEAAKVPTQGIPQVTGLTFDHIVLYEKLPIENDQIFQNILTITKLLNKYDVICDKIQFDASYNVTLGYDKVKVNIGTVSYTHLVNGETWIPYVILFCTLYEAGRYAP